MGAQRDPNLMAELTGDGLPAVGPSNREPPTNTAHAPTSRGTLRRPAGSTNSERSKLPSGQDSDAKSRTTVPQPGQVEQPHKRFIHTPNQLLAESKELSDVPTSSSNEQQEGLLSAGTIVPQPGQVEGIHSPFQHPEGGPDDPHVPMSQPPPVPRGQESPPNMIHESTSRSPQSGSADSRTIDLQPGVREAPHPPFHNPDGMR